MTEKRFRLGANFDGFQDIYDDERVIGCERIIYARKMIDLLNELAEENKQLKKEVVFLQNRLHDCNMESRKLAISEMRDLLDKMERYE